MNLFDIIKEHQEDGYTLMLTRKTDKCAIALMQHTNGNFLYIAKNDNFMTIVKNNRMRKKVYLPL